MSLIYDQARVILRSDGSVHIGFRSKRTIFATAENILALFADPNEFVETGYLSYEDSTFIANRKEFELRDMLGLTLAAVTNDKQIVCHFPELFRYINIACSSAETKNAHLNMTDFAFEEVLSDEKSFLLRHYLELAGSVRAPLTIKKNIQLRDEVQFAIIREILNAFFDEELPEPKSSDDISKRIENIQQASLLKKEMVPDEEYVTVLQYAQIHNLSENAVRSHLKAGHIAGAKRNERGRWLIPRNVQPESPNMLIGRTRKQKNEEKAYRRPANGSAADVEAHIIKQRLFTHAIAPFIHTFQELDYYTKRSYHEVRWNGRPCLIIDVNPDYRCTIDNKTNRERMMAGEAPRVPQKNKEDRSFDLHHVGRNAASPFACIPDYDHNGSGFSSIFHQGSHDKNLHDTVFAGDRKQFWQTYIEEYDKAGRFEKIPYLNPRAKRKK
ncbi:MAG: hypothetical protein E7651_05700 [Ruminococcaceae bacterium]|nr:hypothetical protein [Oscillospiraceae bacterium]